MLDRLGNPDATTLDRVQIRRAATSKPGWISDRKNRRAIPHRLEQCGYVPVRNDAAEDGLWKINERAAGRLRQEQPLDSGQARSRQTLSNCQRGYRNRSVKSVKSVKIIISINLLVEVIIEYRVRTKRRGLYKRIIVFHLLHWLHHQPIGQGRWCLQGLAFRP